MCFNDAVNHKLDMSRLVYRNFGTTMRVQHLFLSMTVCRHRFEFTVHLEKKKKKHQ